MPNIDMTRCELSTQILQRKFSSFIQSSYFFNFIPSQMRIAMIFPPFRVSISNSIQCISLLRSPIQIIKSIHKRSFWPMTTFKSWRRKTNKSHQHNSSETKGVPLFSDMKPNTIRRIRSRSMKSWNYTPQWTVIINFLASYRLSTPNLTFKINKVIRKPWNFLSHSLSLSHPLELYNGSTR